MPRPQLNLRLAPELLERLERTAKATNTTVAALCRDWILRGLDGGLAASGTPSSDGLADRIQAVEARLAALEASQAAAGPVAAAEAPPAPEPPPPAPEPQQLLIPAEEALEAANTGDQFTVAEIAAITGTNAKGWVNWAQGKPPGAVRAHAVAGSWELLGKRPDPRGGPPRLVFRRIQPPDRTAQG